MVRENLKISFFMKGNKTVKAVDNISFTLDENEYLGIVGESGCGKSVTALSIMRLLPQPMGQIMGGEIKLQGEDLTQPPCRTKQRHHIQVPVPGARVIEPVSLHHT